MWAWNGTTLADRCPRCHSEAMPHPLHYDGNGFDRAAALRKDEAQLAILKTQETTRLLPYWRGLSFVADDGRTPWVSGPQARELVEIADEIVFLGMAAEGPFFAADISSLAGGERGPEIAGGRFRSLRAIGATLPAAEAGLAAHARALLHWHARNRHCPACGAPTRVMEGGHSRQCVAEKCGGQHFPRTDPAVIVLVTDGNRCLLGRQTSWPEGFYSCLAGFVEPGESLESAVIREVFEETGVVVAEVGYHASQPWPFPGSLMIGFTAMATGGEPVPDGVELEDARWFHRDEFLPAPRPGLSLPRHDTIAWALLLSWLGESPRTT